MKKIIGIVGSNLIGTDPFAEMSWSGSSRYFFKECQRVGILHSAFGVEAPKIIKYGLMLANFSKNREIWRQKFYLDIHYYNALTREIGKHLDREKCENDCLQIGGIYDVPSLVDGKRKCYSYHDGNLAQFFKSPFFPKGLSLKKIKRALEYERRVYSGLEKIFTMSSYLRQSFIDDFGIAPEKVACIGAGINMEEIPEENKHKDYGKKNILFIGIRFYRKGGAQLLSALKIVCEKHPGAMLHIIGPKYLEIPDELKKSVVHHGFLSKRKTTDKIRFDNILKESSIFVLPSIYEPFGIAPLEAMVNQIPCILTNDWAFKEMVTPGKNGELVDCGNVEELADKINGLLDHPDLLKTLGDFSRKLVLENYTWDLVVKRLINELNF